MGTLAYMAPEQLTRFSEVDPRADVFSLGVILFEMATGRRAFPDAALYPTYQPLSQPPRDLRPSLLARWEAVILRALEKDPAARFADSQEMLAAWEGEVTAAAASSVISGEERAQDSTTSPADPTFLFSRSTAPVAPPERTAAQRPVPPSAWRYAPYAVGAVALAASLAVIWGQLERTLAADAGQGETSVGAMEAPSSAVGPAPGDDAPAEEQPALPGASAPHTERAAVAPTGGGDGGPGVAVVSPAGDGDGDGWTVAAGDCDDADPAVSPGAREICNGIDDDCDQAVDDADSPDPSTAEVFYADRDGDGWGDADDSAAWCEAPAGWSVVKGDCDDDDPAAWPGADEVLGDGVDQDCDGADQASAPPAGPSPATILLPGEVALDAVYLKSTATGAIQHAEGDVFEVAPGEYSLLVAFPGAAMMACGKFTVAGGERWALHLNASQRLCSWSR